MKIEFYKLILNNWVCGIAFYLIPFIIGYLAFIHVLSDKILRTDVDSARYMLSALIQSEAAIVALVVTLSLVAVQLVAQSYSARVIEAFRKAPDLWILMGIYGIAIFYGLGVLKMIETANPQLCNTNFICQSNLEGHIAFSYYLGVFAFVALVPYMWKTLDLLKPSTVIDTLAEEITMQNILDAMKTEDDLTEEQDIFQSSITREFIIDTEKDPIQPIIDIVRSSLMKYDYETVREGLKAIGDHANTIIENKTEETGWEENIGIKHIFSQLKRFGKLAISKEDEDSTIEIIKNFYKIGRTATRQRLEFTTQEATDSLLSVGSAAARQKFVKASWQATIYLSWLGKVAAEQTFVFTTKRIVQSLNRLEKRMFEQELIEASELQIIIESLNEILKIAKGKNLVKAAEMAEESLKKLNEDLTKLKQTAHTP